MADPQKPEPSVFDVIANPMGNKAVNWTGRNVLDQRTAAAVQALRKHRATEQAAKYQEEVGAEEYPAATSPEEAGTQTHEEQGGGKADVMRPLEVPVMSAIGALRGLQKGMGLSEQKQAQGDKNALAIWSQGYKGARQDVKERLGKPKWWGERLATGAMNAVTDLGDVVTGIPGVIAQTTLPRQVPPGAEEESWIEQGARQFREGEEVGKTVAGGAVGGTAAIMEHPLESAEARPFTTAVSYLPFLRGFLNLKRGAGAAARRRITDLRRIGDFVPEKGAKLPEQPEGAPPLPVWASGPAEESARAEHAAGPLVPTTESITPKKSRSAFSNILNYPLEKVPGDAVKLATEKLGKALGSRIPEKAVDTYMRVMADAYHAGDPMMTAMTEEIARSTELGEYMTDALAEEIVSAANRDRKSGGLQKQPEGAPLTGLSQQEQTVPINAKAAVEKELSLGLHQPTFSVRQQPVHGGKPGLMTYSKPDLEAKMHNVVGPESETHPAVEKLVDHVVEQAGLKGDESRTAEFRPAITQDVHLALSDALGEDGKSANWKGQMRGNPEQFAKDYIAAAEQAVGEELTPKERAGLLETIDKRSLDASKAPRTGLEVEGPQEMIHAEKVVRTPEGAVEGQRPEDQLPKSERDALKARKDAMVAAERNHIKASAVAESKVTAAEESAQALEDAERGARAAQYHYTGARDMESNAKQVAKQAAAVETTSRQQANDSGIKATRARAVADAAMDKFHRAAGSTPDQIDAMRAHESGNMDAVAQEAAKKAQDTAAKAAQAKDAAKEMRSREAAVRQAARDATEAENIAKRDANVAALDSDRAKRAEVVLDNRYQAAKTSGKYKPEQLAELKNKLDQARTVAESLRAEAQNVGKRYEAAKDTAVQSRAAESQHRQQMRAADTTAADLTRDANRSVSTADSARAAADALGQAEALDTQTAEMFAEAKRATDEATVRKTEAATATARAEKQRLNLQNAKKSASVADTLAKRAHDERVRALALAEETKAKREMAVQKPEELGPRRLNVTRVVPTINGIELDPAKLVPTRELNPGEFREAIRSSVDNVSKRYSRPSTMGGRLETESGRAMNKGMPEVVRYETLTDEEKADSPADPFIKAAQGQTFENPVSEIMSNEPDKKVAQQKLAATAMGIVQGFVDGDVQPATLPQGMKSVAVARTIRAAARNMDLPEAVVEAVNRLASKIGGYVPADPITGVGTEANPVWVHPLVGDAMKWKALSENPRNNGWIRGIDNMMKSNATTKSIKSGLNNLVPNLDLAGINEGLDPVTIAVQAEKLMYDFHKWRVGGDSAVKPELAAAFKYITRAGGLSVDFVAKEIASKKLTPQQKLRMNPLEAWVKDPTTDLPMDKASAWFYQHGDHIMRIRQGVNQFLSRAEDIASMPPRTHYDLFPTRRTVVRIGREPSGHFTVENPTAKLASDRTPQWIDREQLLQLIAKDATRRASLLVGDYGDLVQSASMAKNSGLDGLLTKFMSWQTTAADAPGKPGLVTNMLFRSPYAVSTNVPGALFKAMRKEAGLFARRAIFVTGLQAKLQDEGSNGELAEDFRKKTSSDQRVIINRLMDPLYSGDAPVGGRKSYVEGLPPLQWAQIGPTGDWLGLVANLAAVPEMIREHEQAKKGEITSYGKAVVKADSGQEFTEDQALRLAYMAGGPIAEAWKAAKEGKPIEDIVSGITDSLMGGNKAAVGRAIVGYISDPGQEEHAKIPGTSVEMKLPPGEIQRAMAKWSTRANAVSGDVNQTMPMVMWLVKQAVGRAWQVKDVMSNNPKEMGSLLRAVGIEMKKGAHATSIDQIKQEAIDQVRSAPESRRAAVEAAVTKTAQEKANLIQVINNTILLEWEKYVKTWETLHNRKIKGRLRETPLDTTIDTGDEPEQD